MKEETVRRGSAEYVVDIVADAGGRLIGRTRLQKTAYLLYLTGLGNDFDFEYRHYGPFSEKLADLTNVAKLFSDLKEDEQPSTRGGTYSVFSTLKRSDLTAQDPRKRLIDLATRANPIELELAATAAFLAREGYNDPWHETKVRKPDKSGSGRLDAARRLYSQFRGIPTPTALPNI